MIHWSADRFRDTEKESDLFLRTYVHAYQIKDAAALKQNVIESVIQLSYFKDD